jgi:hypothetical protein
MICLIRWQGRLRYYFPTSDLVAALPP